jgi:acyl-coenzyme A thioesterase PaaI-like protein
VLFRSGDTTLVRGTRTHAESEHTDYLPRSPFVGVANPVAVPFTSEFRDGRLFAEGTFHAAYEGPPGYVHGGWIALAFDEILGMANIASGHPAMTGKLTVRYRRPTPLHTSVLLEAWTDHVDGKRVITRGTMTAGDTVTAEAEGLFVKIGPERAMEYFGRAREPRVDESPDPLP